MSTSLSRQLEQLRTSSQVSSARKDGGSSVASLGPNILNVDLGSEELTVLAKEGLHELTSACPILGSYKLLLFKDDSNDPLPVDDDVDMDSPGDKSIEDVLFLLSPFIARLSAQYVLQYLITRHKVHINSAESLIFAIIPYSDKVIFNRVVEAVPIRFGKARAEEEFPRWMENFKTACHPATKVGIARHLASDPGFFKLFCHMFVHKLLRGHMKRFSGEEGVNYNQLIHFFVTMMVQGLNLCGTISESHSYNLLQVVLAGLKNDVLKEYRSGVVIIFACLVPRVTFNGKVTKKLIKSLNKMELKDVESLSMLALLFRCQINQIDAESVLSGFLGHQQVLLDQVYFNLSKQVDEDQEFARRLLKSLALLCTKILPAKPNEDINNLLTIVEKALSECLPSHETAEILISSISQALLEYKARKKQKTDTGESLKGCISSCKRILDLLRKSFVEEFAKKSAIRKDTDILFIEGVDQPTAEMVWIKKILLDNQVIRSLTEEIRDEAPELKANMSSLRTVLNASKDFLMKLMSIKQVTCLCLNVLKLIPGKFKVSKLAMRQLLVLNEDQDAVEYLNQQSVTLEALMLRLLFNPAEKNREHLNEMIGEYVEKNADGLISKLMPTWEIAKSEEKKPSTIIKRLYGKLVSVMKGSDITQLSKTIMGGKVHQNEDLVSLVLLVFAEVVKNEPNNEGSIMQLIKMMLWSSKCFSIRKKNKESDEQQKSITYAEQAKAIDSSVLKTAVESLLEVGKEQRLLLVMMAAIWQKQSIDPELTEILLNGLGQMKGHVEFCSALLTMPFKDIFGIFGENPNEADTILKHVHLHALEHIQKTFKNNVEVVKSAMSFESAIVPGLFGGLWSDSKKVRKKIIKSFEVALEKPVARTKYAPLVKAVISNKAAILATSENIPDFIKAFTKEGRSSNAVLEAFLDEAMKCNELMIRMCPIFAFLEKDGLVQLALHATSLLADISNSKMKKDTLEAILVTVGAALAKNMKEASIWEFFLNGIKLQSGEYLQHNGLKKLIPSAVIDTITEHCPAGDLPPSGAKDLLKTLLELSRCDEIDPEHLASARILIKTLMPLLDASVILNAFQDIWGNDVMTGTMGSKNTPLKKRRPFPSDVKEPEKWHMTIFFLEISHGLKSNFLVPLATLLDRALNQQEQSDHAYVLDLLIATLIDITDHLTPEEKEKNPIDPELVIRCIRNCMNPDTKASALMLLAKSTASTNAEYILHNSIQLFTFVGTHFLQMESKSSFEIACTAIDVLVPHILSVCKAKGGQDELREMSINILNTFVDASSDMPRHRFCLFMHQLTQRLGAQDYLWLLTLLLIKADLRKKHYDNLGGQKSTKLTMEERLQQLCDLFSMFDSNMAVQVSALKQMIQYTAKNSQQARKLLGITQSSTSKLSPQEQFDMVRIKMLSFVNYLMTSNDFTSQLIKALRSEEEGLDKSLKKLLEVVVNTMDSLRTEDDDEAMEEDGDEKQAKIRRHLSVCYEKVFESALAILPTPVFMKVVKQLLAINQPTNIQRKALEVLNARFAQKELDDPNLEPILQALARLAITDNQEKVDKDTKDLSAINQQLSLMCIKSMAKLASNTPSSPLLNTMKELCSALTNKSFLKSLRLEPVIAAAILCVSELLSCLGAQGVVHLQSFVKWLLNLMTKDQMKSLIVLNSLVVAVQKAIDNFAGFLNPHFQRLVVASCQLTSWHQDQEENSTEARHCRLRMKQLHQALSRGLPYHNLLNIARPCFDELKNEKDGAAASVVALSTIILESLAQVNKSDIVASSTMTMDLFLHVFKTCRQDFSADEAHDIEEAFGEAFLAFGLKVSLEDFKPLYYKLFSLALDVENVSNISTMFHITTLVGNKLKSLFSFVCEMIVQKATTILQETAKAKDDSQSDMLCYILDALTSIFTFSRVDSLLMKSYEDHVNSILEFLDGSILDEKFLNKIKLCLGQLAATTDDETQWKYLNYQVLMIIRNKSAKIRLTVLEIVDIFVDKRGENYLASLPDSVNFLVEALEDDDYQVEKRCRVLIKKMEEVFGQSIESYFE